MSAADRERWEKAYASPRGSDDEVAARPTIDWIEPASAGANAALDLACGSGRHVRALSRLGYRVTAADISRQALQIVARSQSLGPRPCLVQIDTDAWPFGAASFDLIVQIDFLDRRLFPSLRAAVKPGGSLLIDTFAGPASANVSGPRRSDFRLELGELRDRFADWQVVRYLEEPSPHGRAATLVRRPLAFSAVR